MSVANGREEKLVPLAKTQRTAEGKQNDGKRDPSAPYLAWSVRNPKTMKSLRNEELMAFRASG